MAPEPRSAARRHWSLATWLLSVLTLAACGSAPERSGFEARIRGGVDATMRGATSYSPSSLTLSNDDGIGAVVFGPPDGGLTRGIYGVGPTTPESTRVDALVITGTPSRPAGVFRGRDGTLTVTTATDQRLAGHFDLTAAGIRTDSALRDSTNVHVSGSFLLLRPCRSGTGCAVKAPP